MTNAAKYREASQRVAEFLAGQVGPDGKLLDTSVQGDLNAQYKLTTLLHVSGFNAEAQRLLGRIKRDFMQDNGDFVSYPGKTGRDRKSDAVPMTQYWMYINAWIGMGAQRVGRFDISYPAFEFCRTFVSPATGGCCVTDPYSPDKADLTVDTMCTAHFGLMCLYFGDLQQAKACGECLLQFISKQPDFSKQWLLRMNAHTGDVITTIPEGQSPFYVVRKSGVYDLFFFLGYHAIFMTKLYQVTKDKRFLESSRTILEFAMQCDTSLYTFHLSHKVAYGAALYYSETKDETFKKLSEKIADFILTKQADNGPFCTELSPTDAYDQSAELGIWLREIAAELSK